MSRGRQKQHPPDEDEAESGLTTALKAGVVGLGLGALAAFGKWLYDVVASSHQPPAPTVNHLYVDNRTFQQNNLTLQQNNLTLQQNNHIVVIDPQRRSNQDQYPYRHRYPPSNPSLPVCSSDQQVSQYDRNNTVRLYDPNIWDDGYDNPASYRWTGTAQDRPQSYSSSTQRSSANNLTLQQNNLTLQQNNRIIVIDPQRQSNQDQYPYRHRYPPSNPSLPVCSSDQQVSQYERTVVLNDPNGRNARYDNRLPSYGMPTEQELPYAGPRATAPNQLPAQQHSRTVQPHRPYLNDPLPSYIPDQDQR